MLFHSRHRRGSYPLAASSAYPVILKWIVAGVLALLVLYVVGSFVLRVFGVGNAIRHEKVTLHVEGRDAVNVYLDGAEMQRAQDGMKLYPGDRVTTGSNTHATMVFFDGSMVRLDEKTDLTVAESALGVKTSELELELQQGRIWLATPLKKSFTGAIVRTVITPVTTFVLPAETEAVLSALEAYVYSADGSGIEVEVLSSDADAVYIGEGQKWMLPSAEDVGEDLFAYRSALDPTAARMPLVEESRVRRSIVKRASSPVAMESGTDLLESGFLRVRAPANNAKLTAGTVKVEGSFAEGVATIKVNEYTAVSDEEKKTFAQELALPSGVETFEIRIAALDSAGEILEEVRRTVTREFKAPDAPTITSPAKQGQTYRTQTEEFVLRGGSPAGAVGIIVNDYRLQLFSPSKGEWSYLASTRLGNYKQGENIFSVVAIDDAGNKSAPAVLKIILGEGTEGVIAEGTSTSSVAAETPEELPNNAPLKPGSLVVTGPTAGTAHTATGSEFLIEGTTIPETAGVWVNDYQLQLYVAGKTFWNYIANTEYGNLKRGKNIYVIVTRNAKNEILDRVEYTVTYNP